MYLDIINIIMKIWFSQSIRFLRIFTIIALVRSLSITFKCVIKPSIIYVLFHVFCTT